MSRLADVSLQASVMGVLMAIVGFTSTGVLVLQGFISVGANDAQAASGLMSVTVACGLSGVWLSWRRRLPIAIAWSAPGAALLLVSGGSSSGFDAAVGAFVACALLLIVSGAVRPVGRFIESIPRCLANAMLAGILLPICLAPVRALDEQFAIALPLLLAWWLAGRVHRLAAVPVALAVLVGMVAWRLGVPDDFGARLAASTMPVPVPVMPRLDWTAIIGIGVPLFIVTMASQNVPGVAVQRAYGIDVRAGPLILNTGLFSLAAAPLGSHAVNLAAITAAMGAGPDAHPDPARRWWAPVVAGGCYVVFGLLAGTFTLLITLVPTVLIEAIAGLALLGAFTAAAYGAFEEAAHREAAAVTFLFAASGLAFHDIGGAFWGLLAGGIMYGVGRARTATTPPVPPPR